jgi:deoxyribonuclease-4
MNRLYFGTGGTPHSAKSRTSVDGIKRIAELGLGCMELEFVHGVNMGEENALLIRETAVRTGVKLTAHAPYYINFNAHEPEKIRASQRRLLQTARIASLCGAESIALHTAFYLGDTPEKTYVTAKKYLDETLSQLKEENNLVWIRPEVMGKGTQFGTIEEVLTLSRELEKVAPCIDFAHWHARTGRFNSYIEFASVLEQLIEQGGRVMLDNMHIHLSGIAYSEKGERKHLNLVDSDLHYDELLQALKNYEARGLVICESPNLEEDAQTLQAVYHNLSKKS